MIEDGGVQWMTAGRGIIHSEMPKVTEGDLWGFQLWINLPKKDKMTKPQCASFPSPPLTQLNCNAFCTTLLFIRS